MKTNKGFFLSKSKRIRMLILAVASWVVSAGASTGMTVQGRILRPDGSPVVSSHVQFRVQIRSPGNENCLLYQESQTLDMSQSNGLFSLTVGAGTRTEASVDGGYSLDRIFANRGTLDLSSTVPDACAIGAAYSPGVADGRKLVYYFNDGSGWQTAQAIGINWVPLALESLQVGGFRVAQLLRVVDAFGNPG